MLFFYHCKTADKVRLGLCPDFNLKVVMSMDMGFTDGGA